MPKRNRRSKKSAMILPVLLIGSSVLVTCVGFALKARLKTVGGYERQLAVAVPFLMLYDDTDLHLPQSPSAPVSTEPSAPQTTPQETEPVTVPATQQPETTAPSETQPLPVYGEDESWFDDALFLGDSRMVGLSQYARLGEADYFADVGLTVFQLFSQTAADIGFERTDLTSLLSNRQYGKIYIMLGLNEAGYPLDSLENEFRQDIEQIQALQPEADIYLLQVYGVSREKAAAVSYLTPEHLQEINAMIASLCDGTQVRCLDPRPLYEDEAGYLIAEYTGDGVHPYGKYDALLSQWLCRQAG